MDELKRSRAIVGGAGIHRVQPLGNILPAADGDQGKGWMAAVFRFHSRSTAKHQIRISPFGTDDLDRKCSKSGSKILMQSRIQSRENRAR